MPRESSSVAGVDVGGAKKGFHAVALRDGNYEARYSSCSASAMVSWCKEVNARAVGIDAPCRWSNTGRARLAERQLMAKGIWCFSTPTKAVAKAHPRDHFGWMLNGAALYEALSDAYPLYTGEKMNSRRVSFETFPHAIVCALIGEVVPAHNKRMVRRALLTKSKVETNELTNIDYVDAALCALAAYRLLRGKITTYGSADEGFIVVPTFD